MIACARMEVEEDTGEKRHAKKTIDQLQLSSSQSEDEGTRDMVSMPAAAFVVPVGRRSSLVEALEYRGSPSCSPMSRNVVIVMDALKDFSTEPLEWALANVIKPGSVVTLLGAMPWLNFILSCKTWLDVWTLNLDDLHALRERSELMKDNKYQKIRAVLELCEKHGVVPHMKVAMGDPLRLVVAEHVISLHAIWVVFDRHHQKNKDYYAKKIPCNMVMMNNAGEVEILKVRPMIESSEAITPEASPASRPLIPKVMISKEWMEILKSKELRSEKTGILNHEDEKEK